MSRMCYNPDITIQQFSKTCPKCDSLEINTKYHAGYYSKERLRCKCSNCEYDWEMACKDISDEPTEGN